ncbi:hypothetical protein TNCV_1638151 [Trichonephila clavipes]|nr:hypothetical protein TNCV_1638151 [Trichonephila clavipes]
MSSPPRDENTLPNPVAAPEVDTVKMNEKIIINLLNSHPLQHVAVLAQKEDLVKAAAEAHIRSQNKLLRHAVALVLRAVFVKETEGVTSSPRNNLQNQAVARKVGLVKILEEKILVRRVADLNTMKWKLSLIENAV